ncbi:MAG: C45 family autoproteolytic acyltransferase/hydrolase [Candidatus Aminicenantes bacterium]|nr:C45 family autoproteolytic acyltransferase/hydrolase [Candidatus Aminicenantes bacterium]
MIKSANIFLVVVLFLSLSVVAAEERRIIPLNPGFETNGNPGLPAGWKVVGPAERASADTTVFHGGHASLRLRHAEPASSSVFSEPVKLQVGRFYRLRAWLRTVDAFTNPADRYPTPVAACLAMESFPFTNHSPAAGASSEWREVTVIFVATRAIDRIGLHFGYNGKASGTAWFDDVQLEEITDIGAVVPAETIQRYGKAFRFSDRGWTFLHIEGKPYSRGYQHGYLMANEIATYMEKLAVLQNSANPAQGWSQLRLLTDALLLRQYEEEYLLEMRGMADGMNARKTVMKHKSGPIELLDIVAINSAIDLGQMESALARTATPLSGRDFPPAGEEQIPDRLHKCSGLLANRSATANGDLVFFQMFMWNGYTGVSFNVMCDMVPESGRRLVYETFPGGIHSGTDFYLNDAGIMIGETTTQQTPFDGSGIPQSDRIRKAAQYATSVDDVVRILTTRNNGLYTNDWLIADARRNEIAVMLQGTKKYKLWRGRDREFPGDTTDFYWCVNNAKDPEVRKEYIPDAQNSPFDLNFSPSNRDIVMFDFYRQNRGKIDLAAAIGLMASSPINRPHACDGKITTGEMAREMVFMAHYGKTTLREKIPGETPRMPLLPDAVPHLTLGYTTFSPRVLSAMIQTLPAAQGVGTAAPVATKLVADVSALADLYAFAADKLWSNTVYPASAQENWFVSASAAYHGLLRRLPADGAEAAAFMRDSLTEMNDRLLFLIGQEGNLTAVQAERNYGRYGSYQIPRIRGTFLLHQLHLAMGSQAFSAFMKDLHARFRNRPMSNMQFKEILSKAALDQALVDAAEQWLTRPDLPAPALSASSKQDNGQWKVTLEVVQPQAPYFCFWTTVRLETEKKSFWKPIEVKAGRQSFEFVLADKPVRLIFNAGNDIPTANDRFFTFSHFNDRFASTRVVYGTCREIEAFHSLGLRFCTVLADAFSETLPPLHKDSEVTQTMRTDSDLIVLGGSEDNLLTRELGEKLGLKLGKNWFSWNGQVFGQENDGLLAVYPNPDNPRRMLTLIIANSALQLYQMTKAYQILPSWALFRGENVVERGYHYPAVFSIDLN